MKLTYLTVLTTEIETESFEDEGSDWQRGVDPMHQSAVATYLSCAVTEGMAKEDSRDRLLDERTYAISECIGTVNALHAVIYIRIDRENDAYWCKTCGAFKEGSSKWQYPEIRIDKHKEK